MSSFRHRRDFRNSRTDVVVKGVGGECVGGTMHGNYCVGGAIQLVWARYLTHIGDYPCRYLPFGWGGEPYFSAEIGTVAQADQVAHAIGDRVWGAIGTLTWQTDGIAVGSTTITRFAAGDLIALDDPVEGQVDARYVIREVTQVGESTGHPVWEITVGDLQPDIVDIIRGVTVIQPIQQLLHGGGTATGTTLGPAQVPSAPKAVGVSRAPTHDRQNIIQARDRYTTGLTFVRGYKAPDEEIDPDKEPGNQVEHYDHLGNLMDWTDELGAAPARIGMDFPVAGTATWLADENGVVSRILLSTGSVTVTMAIRMVGQPLPPIYLPGVVPGAPPIPHSVGVPVPYTEGDDIAITVDGPCQVTLSHRATRVIPP